MFSRDFRYEKYGKGITARTRLHGWSVTKSMFAAVLAARIKEGKISLDTAAGELIRDWASKPSLARITVRQLLQMSDGLSVLTT
jgi:CubicO group peptidase (beta-lactamase class C family)